MPASPTPELNAWYQDSATGQMFKIVAIDPANDAIELQYYNGDLAEFDFASWFASGFAAIEAPEDWSAPFDDVEADDLGYSDPDQHRPDWQELTLDDILQNSDTA